MMLVLVAAKVAAVARRRGRKGQLPKCWLSGHKSWVTRAAYYDIYQH